MRNFVIAAIFLFVYWLARKRMLAAIKSGKWIDSSIDRWTQHLNFWGSILLLLTSVSAPAGLFVSAFGLALPVQLSLISPLFGLFPILLAHEMQIARIRKMDTERAATPSRHV